MDSVLVVDDDRSFRDVVCHAIRSDGFAPIAAASGREALELVRASPPKLILLNLVMPGVNGLQFLSVVRSDPITSGIPVIAFSAAITDDVTKQAMALGADVILYKTRFSMMELRRVVKQQLAKRRSSAA